MSVPVPFVHPVVTLQVLDCSNLVALMASPAGLKLDEMEAWLHHLMKEEEGPFGMQTPTAAVRRIALGF